MKRSLASVSILAFSLLGGVHSSADQLNVQIERPLHHPPYSWPRHWSEPQKKCFTDAGLDAPGSDKSNGRGMERPHPTAEQRKAVDACLEKNGFVPHEHEQPDVPSA